MLEEPDEYAECLCCGRETKPEELIVEYSCVFIKGRKDQESVCTRKEWLSDCCNAGFEVLDKDSGALIYVHNKGLLGVSLPNRKYAFIPLSLRKGKIPEDGYPDW